MSGIQQARQALVQRILDGEGESSRDERRAAFDNARLEEPVRTLVAKVARDSDQVTDGDIAAARRAGLTEDQIFEIVVCAAIGEATRQYDAALAALRNAMH